MAGMEHLRGESVCEAKVLCIAQFSDASADEVVAWNPDRVQTVTVSLLSRSLALTYVVEDAEQAQGAPVTSSFSSSNVARVVVLDDGSLEIFFHSKIRFFGGVKLLTRLRLRPCARAAANEFAVFSQVCAIKGFSAPDGSKLTGFSKSEAVNTQLKGKLEDAPEFVAVVDSLSEMLLTLGVTKESRQGKSRVDFRRALLADMSAYIDSMKEGGSSVAEEGSVRESVATSASQSLGGGRRASRSSRDKDASPRAAPKHARGPPVQVGYLSAHEAEAAFMHGMQQAHYAAQAAGHYGGYYGPGGMWIGQGGPSFGGPQAPIPPMPAWGGGMPGQDGAFAGANPFAGYVDVRAPGAPAGWMYAPCTGPTG
jgi:hypothetical protein